MPMGSYLSASRPALWDQYNKVLLNINSVYSPLTVTRMKGNVGKTDKTVRVFIGFTIIGIGLSMQSWLGAIGIIPLASALLGW